MKKTNMIAALAIIALSATQVMAYQFDNYQIDKELTKNISTSIQDTINTQYQEQNGEVEKDPYRVYLHAYLDLISLMDDPDFYLYSDNIGLFKQHKLKKRRDIFSKKIFDTINNLSEAILNLPEYDPENYYSIAEHVICIDENLSYNPVLYLNRAVTLQELFNFALKNKSLTYDENTPVVKILDIQKKVKMRLNSITNENNYEIDNNDLSGSKFHAFWKGILDWLNSPEGKSVLEGFQNQATAGK